MKTCQLTWFRRAVLELARSEGGGQRRDGCFFLGCESLVLSLHRQVVAGGRGHCRLASWPCISGPTCGGCIGAQCSVTPLIGRRGQHGHHQDSKVSLASVRKEHKSSGWWRRTTPCVHGFHIGMGRDPDPHDEPSAQNRGCQLHSIPNIQRTRRATKNLVQFLQDMYIYTRVVQFQYEVPATLSIKAPPKNPSPSARLESPNRGRRDSPNSCSSAGQQNGKFRLSSPFPKENKSRASSMGSQDPPKNRRCGICA